MAKIRFTPIAKYKYDKILDYTYEEFGETTERRFEEAFLNIADRLSAHPLSSPREPLLKNFGSQYRSANIRKNWKIIYRYHEIKDEITIIDLWNMRRNPKTLVRNFKRMR